jgi:hypothetical protein
MGFGAVKVSEGERTMLTSSGPRSEAGGHLHPARDTSQRWALSMPFPQTRHSR